MVEKSLRKLTSETPSDEDLPKIMAELEKGSDRSLAILAPIQVQNSLADLIREKCKNLDEKEIKRLYQHDGLLYGFSTTIQLAFVLGLITPELRNDLDIIRQIRNAFAHAPRPISFATDEITRECKRLKSLDRFKAYFEEGQWDYSKLSSRTFFMTTTLAISFHLVEQSKILLGREIRSTKKMVTKAKRERRAIVAKLLSMINSGGSKLDS
jgi:DNA-binding MltR family transcriptional regulator